MALTTAVAPGLANLVAPINTAEFMAEHWGKRSLLLQRGNEPLDGLFRRVASCSVRELLQMTDSAMVMHYTRCGEYRGTRVATAAAFAFYQANLPLYFDLSQRLPEVATWIDALARDLGQRTSRLRVSVFASPKGGLTECHFDSNENFTVQIHGRKRWRMAPNTSVDNPVDRFTVSLPKTQTSALYFTAPFDSTPALEETAELAPGSMLYVPRGYWHEAEALEASISVNFCIAPETWLSYLLPLIERRLLAETSWRAMATGIRGTPAERSVARIHACHLLETLSVTLSDLSGAETIPEASGAAEPAARLDDTIALRRSRTALLHWVTDSRSAGDQLIIRVETASSGAAWTASPSLARACTWVAEQREFTRGEYLGRWSDISAEELRTLLNRLVSAGFLYTADERTRLGGAS